MTIVLVAAVFLSAQAPAGEARLDAYAGSWGAYSGRIASISGRVEFDSRFVNIAAKKTGVGVIELTADQWGAKARLRFDKTSGKFLLSWNADGFPAVTDVPLAEAAGGFTGTSTFACEGGECKASAEIKPKDGGGSAWELVVERGKDRWSLNLRLGKEK